MIEGSKNHQKSQRIRKMTDKEVISISSTEENQKEVNKEEVVLSSGSKEEDKEDMEIELEDEKY